MTSFLVHGFLPESLMSVILVPIIKDKSGKINSKDNYRPIAIASIMSKLLEKLLLERLNNYFVTSSHQFGFKPKHSTDACIYVLKETINSYVENKVVFSYASLMPLKCLIELIITNFSIN